MVQTTNNLTSYFGSLDDLLRGDLNKASMAG